MSIGGPSRRGLEKVLAKLGRASTPAVRETTTGMSLSRLLGQGPRSATSHVMLYGLFGVDLHQELIKKEISFRYAIPGDSFMSLPTNYSGVVVIDRSGFQSGPWLGIESESGIRFREEVYDLCRLARTNGIPVWFLDIPESDSFSVVRIKSACDVVFPYFAHEDFEEGAPTNAEFDVLSAVVAQRFRLEDIE